jgi:hypothetical protein
MARQSTVREDEERESGLPDVPWASLLPRAAAHAAPVVGNASPAEQPGLTSQQYADAAAVEKQKGNEDAAARLLVRSSETRSQEFAQAGTPEPTSPLPQAAPASMAKGPTLSGGEQLQAPALAESTSWGALAGAGKKSKSAEDEPDTFGQPPGYEPPSVGGNLFALGLDAVLNKGRNAGRIVNAIVGADDSDYVNYQRRIKAAKDKADIEATKRRGIETPEEQALREARLKLAQDNVRLRGEQIANQGEGLELRKAQDAIKNDANHPSAVRLREQAYAQGWAEPGSLDGLSNDQMKSGTNKALSNAADLAMADELNRVAAKKASAVADATDDNKVRTAAAISDATQANKLELVAAGQTGKIEAEERAEGREQIKRGEDYKKWFSKEAEKDLAIARLMDEIDSTPGGVTPTLMERFKGAITARGIDPARMKSWQAKQMVLELWARQQSGAAISDSEEARFARQAALDPLAGEEQVNAAYEVLGDVMETWLRSKAAGRPSDARAVGEAAGVNADRWFGAPQPAQQPAPVPRKRAPAPRVKRAAPQQVSEDELEF